MSPLNAHEPPRFSFFIGALTFVVREIEVFEVEADFPIDTSSPSKS
jgi:hypothetical protein